MCSFTRAKRTSQGEAVITHEVRITFRLRNTSFQKRKSTSFEVLSFLVAGRGFTNPVLRQRHYKTTFILRKTCKSFEFAEVQNAISHKQKQKPVRWTGFRFWLRGGDLNLLFSLRLGHLADLTVHWTVIQHRSAVRKTLCVLLSTSELFALRAHNPTVSEGQVRSS